MKSLFGRYQVSKLLREICDLTPNLSQAPIDNGRVFFLVFVYIIIMPATPRGTAILGSRLRYNKVCQQAEHKGDTKINHNFNDQVA